MVWSILGSGIGGSNGLGIESGLLKGSLISILWPWLVVGGDGGVRSGLGDGKSGGAGLENGKCGGEISGMVGAKESFSSTMDVFGFR